MSPFRRRLTDHFAPANGSGRGVTVLSMRGTTGPTSNPVTTYEELAPPIDATRFTRDPYYVSGTLAIQRVSDDHIYISGTDFSEVEPGAWMNLTIPEGTPIRLNYHISELGSSGMVTLQLEGVSLPLSPTWNLAEGFEAEKNPQTGAIDITAIATGTGSGTGGPVEGVRTITLLNGWAYVSPGQVPGYYKDRERVFFRGRIGGGTATVGTVLFTLPAEYRPTQLTTLLAAGDNAQVALDFQTDGDVVIADSAFAVGTDWLSLDGLSYRIVDVSEAEFQNWGQTDIVFDSPEMDALYSELP